MTPSEKYSGTISARPTEAASPKTTREKRMLGCSELTYSFTADAPPDEFFVNIRHDRGGAPCPAIQAYAILPSKRTGWAWASVVWALLGCSPIRVPPPPAAEPSAIGRTLTRGDAVADIDTLMRTLEDVHPDLYAERPRDSVAAARQRIVASLPPSMTRADLWLRLAPILASLGDGHTNIAMPSDEFPRGALVFPPSVVQDDAGHLVVVAAFSQGAPIQRGDRIVSLNGKDADSLVRAWTAEVSGE